MPTIELKPTGSNVENGYMNSSSGLVEFEEKGMSKKVKFPKYCVVLNVILILTLTGLCIGLYFIGLSAGASSTGVTGAISVTDVTGVTQVTGVTGGVTVTTTAAPVDPTASIKPSANLGYRLPRNIVPTNYRVTLFPDIYGFNSSEFTFSGWEIITFTVQIPTDRVFLHSDRVEIDQSSVGLFENLPDDAEPYPFDTMKSEVALLKTFRHENYSYHEFVFEKTLEQSKTYKLRLAWKGRLLRELYGLYLSSYTDSKGTHYLAATQFQPTHARKAFPSLDEPDFKAVFEGRLIHKDSFIALFNTDVKPGAAGTGVVMVDRNAYIISYFLPTVKMSTYLVAFAVSDFEMISNQSPNTGVMYRFWGRPEWKDKMNYIASITRTINEYLDTYYGTTYPFSKMDFIAIPDYAAGAMENWGLVTFQESSFYFDPARDPFSQKERIVFITVHELAHMQFGNTVTAKWWNDIWLNEGFASYVEYVGSKSVESTWDLEQRVLISDVVYAMRTDCLNSTRPITQDVGSPSSISAMFDTISYSKGASLNRMMSGFLTEETFRKALNIYLATYKFDNTVHKNLFDVLTGQTIVEGKKLDVYETMKGWTLQAGYPVVTAKATFRQTGGDPRLEVALKQEPFELDKGKFGKRLWSIPITSLISTNPTWDTSAAPSWLTGESGSIAIRHTTVSASWNGWFVLNLKHSGYYRVNYDVTNWNRLIDQLYTDHNAIEILVRAQLMDDAHNLARGAYDPMTYALALNMTSYLCREVGYAPWQVTYDNLLYVEKMLTFSEYDAAMKKYGAILVSRVYQAVGWESSDTEPSTNHFLRTSTVSRACSWNVTDCLEKAHGYFTQWRANTSYIIPTDTIGAVRCYGIKQGDYEDWIWLFNLYTTTTVQADRNNYINALACSTNVTALAWFLEVSNTDKSIPLQEFPNIFTAVAGNAAAHNISRQFFYANWERLLLDGATFSSPRRLLEATFQFVNTEAEFNEVMKWKQSVNLGTAEASFDNVVVMMQNNIAWMSTYGAQVGTWITAFDENPVLPAECASS